MKKLLIIIAILLIGYQYSGAQTDDRKWSIGLHGGAEQYWGDQGHGFYRFDKGFYGFGGLSVSRYLSSYFDVTLQGTYGTIGYAKSTNSLFHSTLIFTDLTARFKFLGNDKAKVSPYIFLGIGYMRFMDKNTDEKWNNLGLPSCGIGLTYHVLPFMSIRFQEKYVFSNYDKVDHISHKADDSYLQHDLSLEFNFGKAKDTDKDGVPDNKDKCPTVKGLLKFDGCPDTDNDGVVDADDVCPGTPENVKVDAKGCPLDTDGDGIADYLDKCPDVKGLAKFEGCPDTDGDGVTDANDKCPNTPANVKVDSKGCPVDTDGDGIADYLDKCPNDKGLESLNGCPDKDGDGVPDYLDKCPDVKGIAANKGCPEVKQEVKEIFRKALQGIQFETGKDIIRPVSFPILNNVVTIMKENKEYNLIINGHTDNVGNPEANMTLSQKRSDAVKAYLVKKGIDASRMKAYGFGETKPVEDNKTAAGRAKNRRVEFVVEF